MENPSNSSGKSIPPSKGCLHRLTGDDGREREFLRYRMEVQEFMQARDLARNELLPFPKRASFDDGGGTILWEVAGIEINPRVTDSDFKPAIPDDFQVIEDGEIRRQIIKGGTKGRQQRFEEDAQKARDAMAASVPPKPPEDGGRTAWRFALPLGLGLIIVLLVAFKLRSG